MSTRCQIQFSEDDYSYKQERVLIYKHHDGYPDGEHGVINLLTRFFKWNGNNTDMEYLTANFIFFCKLESIHHMNLNTKEIKKTCKDTNRKVETIESIINPKPNSYRGELYGMGICQPNDFHGDIEYVYYVNITSENGISVEVKDSPRVSSKTISTHILEV